MLLKAPFLLSWVREDASQDYDYVSWSSFRIDDRASNLVGRMRKKYQLQVFLMLSLFVILAALLLVNLVK